MNTQVHSKTFISLVIAASMALTAAPSFAGDSFQEKILLNPGKSMLKAEARGRVMIYDGLQVALVEQAMDEHFDRIDNMMFTRVHHPMEDGSIDVDDDGCDY